MHKIYSQLRGFNFFVFISYPTDYCIRNGNGDGDGVCPDFGDGDIFEYGSHNGTGNFVSDYYQRNQSGNNFNTECELSIDYYN